jgi:hypothetical protein
MKTWWLGAGAMAACASLAAPAGGAVVKTSMGVSVTVVATCRVMPGGATGCAPPVKGQPAATPAPQPVVTYSVDPKTGTHIETIEF